MKKEIIIENLKGIKNLKFPIPEKKGVYLLVGPNGIGKSTLLLCMHRICNNLAFATGFKDTSTWNEADQYTQARIKYNVDGKCITFRKSAKRWSPLPRKNSDHVLKMFGFSDSVFIQADSRRIEIKQDELRKGNLENASEDVKGSLNQLFDTQKYKNLRRLRNSNGRGRNATYFYVLKDDTKYYSEKRFSTGELALVRLVEQIQEVEGHALILLDEAELALHPKVQIKLLDYLREKAEEKHLMIFVSTHSPTMIRATQKEQIYLLKEIRQGEIKLITPCYPASAVGTVDYEATNIFDYIFFVEDDVARALLKHMLGRYQILEDRISTAMYNIIPVGGFAQTAEMAIHTNERVFAKSKVFAVVDQDAFENLDEKPVFSKLLKEHPKHIKGFPFTPENWLIERFEKSSNELKEKIRKEFKVEVDEILSNTEYKKCNSTKPRQLAKDKFNVVIQKIEAASGESEDVAKDTLIKFIVTEMAEGELKRFLGPMFSTK